MSQFKDLNGNILVKGDLIMLNYRRLGKRNPVPAVFKEIDSKNTLTYYALTEIGLSLTRFDSGEEQEEGRTHRQDPYILKTAKSKHVLKRSVSSLSPEEKRIYDEITALL